MALGGLEAVMLGAAMGAGSSALTGGDPLKGALFGGLGGAIIPGGMSLAKEGIASLLPAAAETTAQAALPAATNAAAGATQGLNALSSGLPPDLLNLPLPQQAAANFGMNPSAINMANQSGMVGNFGDALGAFRPEYGVPMGASETATAALTPAQQNIGLEAAQAGQEAARESALSSLSKGMPKGEISLFDDPLGYIKKNQFLAGSTALAGALGGQRKIKPPERKKIEGLPIWQYGYSGGGITALASGGISDLGTYSDGGRMLKGAGDGMSDSIPGVIAGKRPARLADSEFVVPADVVSHLGNGSTDAGAKQLYKMMDRVRVARTGTKKQGRQINPMKYLPA